MPHGPPSCLGIYVLIRGLCGHATALTPAVGNLGRYGSGRDWVIFGPPVASFAIFNFDVIWGNNVYDHALEQRIAGADARTAREIVGTVVGLPREGARHIRFDFRILGTSPEVEARLVGSTVRLRWYKTDNVLTPGSQWQLVVKLHSTGGYRSQHGFNYELFLLENGI